MGADLYIDSIIKPAQERYNPEFLELCRQRDNAKTDVEREEYQTKIWECWDRMYPELGYFRDSYNDSSLLWQLGLSWWEDVNKLLDDEGYLTPEKAKVLWEMVASREVPCPVCGAPVDEEYAYFVDKKAKLLRFLAGAIEIGEPIRCSI